MNKIALTIIMIGLAIGLGIILMSDSKLKNNNETDSTQTIQNVEMKDGVQYITINAKGGYSPKVSNAKANIPTKLIIKTKGTFDCSSSLVIRSLNYQKILAQNGEEVIDIGTPKVGAPLHGVCSMGMYSFQINFT